MGWRGPLVLAAIAAGLAWLAFRADEEPSAESLAQPALAGRSLHRAERIRIQSGPDRQPILLARTGRRGFELVEPLRDDASEAFLDALAGQWDAARLVRFASVAELGEAGLRDKGFSPPRARFEVEFEDRRFEFALGAQALLPHEIYVRTGDVIHRGHLGLFSSLQGNVDDLRERLVVEHPPDQVERLALVRRAPSGSTSTLALERGVDGWRIIEPRQSRADAALVWQFVQAVCGIRVDQFVAGNVTSVRGEPELRIDLRGGFGEERIEFWPEVDGALLGYATRRELHFRVLSADLARMFEVPLDALRSRLLLAAPVERLQRIRIETAGAKPIDLRLGLGEGWRLHAPQVMDTYPTAVSMLLDALRGLVVEEFVDDVHSDPARGGLEQGMSALELTEQNQRDPLRLIVGAEVGGRVLARRAGEEDVVRVPAEQAAVLRQPWTAYAGRQVLELGLAGAIPMLQVRREGAVRRFRLGSDGAWREEGKADRVGAAGEAVDLLRDLHAVRVLDSDGVGELGGGTRVSLHRENGDELGWVEVHEREGKMIARSPRFALALYELRDRDARVLRALIQP